MVNSFLDFVCSVLTKDETVKLAMAILTAQDLRENSWIAEAEDYYKTHKTAAEEALSIVYYGNYPASYVNLIQDLNNHYWNDVQEWAKRF